MRVLAELIGAVAGTLAIAQYTIRHWFRRRKLKARIRANDAENSRLREELNRRRVT